MIQQVAFLGGLVTMGFIVAGLFFLRFWRRTKDNLFRSFAFAFWLFAANQAVVSLGIFPLEQQSFAYLLRLAGYALIIVAIAAKNVRAGLGKPPNGPNYTPPT